MFSSLVQQICETVGGVLGQIPFVGDVFSQICGWIVELLTSLGL